jgi:hypothetical protein
VDSEVLELRRAGGREAPFSSHQTRKDFKMEKKIDTNVLIEWLEQVEKDPKGFTPSALRLLCKEAAKKIRELKGE